VTQPPEERHHTFVGADDDDWAWRRRIRSNPTSAMVYRVLVFAVGLVLVLGGLALVPLPGPGWLVVILGLVVWASEFERAQVVLDWVKARVNAWQQWILAQPLWVRVLAGLVTFVFVCAVVWVLLRFSGVPTFLPDGVESWLHDVARLP
jgi:uncharacterized protein (TIGR02611 family)